MNHVTREHYRREAQSCELTAQRAETELRIMAQRGDNTEWKLESLRECRDDARAAAADFRRVMGTE